MKNEIRVYLVEYDFAEENKFNKEVIKKEAKETGFAYSLKGFEKACVIPDIL